MTSASVAPFSTSTTDNQIGYSGAKVTFTFVTSQPLLSGGKVIVTFPVWNSQASSSNQDAMISTSTPSCSGVTNLSPSSCQFSNNQLVLSNVVSSQMASGTTFSFTVNSVLNPYSAKPWTGFYITTADSSGGYIETSSAFTYQVTTATSFVFLDLELSSSTIGQATIYKLTYQVDLPIDSSCEMVIVGPSGVDMTTSFTSATGSSVFQFATSSKTVATNSITITGCSSYADENSNTDLIQIQQVVNPGEVMTTTAFSIYLYALSGSSQYIIAQDTSSVTVQSSQLTAGTMSSLSVAAATDTIVQESTSYKVTFTPQDSLVAASRIDIQFPITDTYFKLTANTACTLSSVSGGLVTSPSTCTISSGNLIQMRYPFGTSGTYTGGNALSFTISSGINPTSVKDAGTFTFTTYNTISGTDYTVDTYSGSGLFTPTKGTISQTGLSVTSSSYVTYDYPVYYTITFRPTHTIPQNGLIKITIPISSIGIYSSSNLQTYCYMQTDGGSQKTLSSVTVSTSTGLVTISDATSTSAWVPSTTGTSISIILNGLINPSSLLQSQSFQIETDDSSGNVIDTVTTGLTVTMTTINQLNSVTVTPSSVINGATNTYTISVNSKTPLSSGNIFTLTFPAEVTLPSSASCSTVSSLSAVSCTISGQKLSASLTFTSSTASTFSFSLASVVNPYSTKPSSAFTSIYTTDSSGSDISQYTTNSIYITDTTAATISTASLVQASSSAGTSTQYTMTIQTINQIPSTGAIVVQYPSGVTIASTVTTMSPCQVVYNGITYAMTCTINTNANKVTMTSGLSAITIPGGSSVQVILGPITNPSATVTSSMIVSTYADPQTLYIIDQASSGMVPTISCTSPCKTCLSTDATKCLSCYTSTTTIYIYLYSQQCLSSCPQYYYADSTSTCQACMTQCYTCSSTTTCNTCNPTGTYPYYYSSNCYTTCPISTYLSSLTCYACSSPCNTCSGPSNGNCNSCLQSSSNSLVYLLGNTCYSTCPSGYYAGTNNVCTACTSPCATCSSVATSCSSCTTGYYLYGTTCVTSCPSGYVIILNSCLACTSPCSTCSVTQTTCSTCVTGYYLSSNTCLSSCSSGYVLVSGSCVACTSPCSTCIISQTTCLTCVNGYSFYASGCVLTCPSGYVSVSSVCTACTAPCSTCTANQNTCLTCNNGYYLYSSSCVSTCPTGYVAVSGICQQCTSPCLTCTVSQTQCLTCITTYYLYGTTCVGTCPSGYFSQASTMTCVVCDANCKTCQSTSTSCTSCATGYILLNNACYSTCPTGYTLNTAGTQCVLSSSTSTNTTTTNTTTYINNTVTYNNTITNTTIIYLNGSSGTTNTTTNTTITPPIYNTTKPNKTNNNNNNSTNTTNGTNSTNHTKNSTKNNTKNSTNSTPVQNNTVQQNSTPANLSYANDLGYPYLQFGQLMYFPFTMLGAVGHLISIGSYFKDKSSSIASNTVGFGGPIGMLALGSQVGLSYYTEQKQFNSLLGSSSNSNDTTTSSNNPTKRILIGVQLTAFVQKYQYPVITIVTAMAVVILVLLNIFFTLAVNCFSNQIKRDENFRKYKKKHKKCCLCIFTCSTIFNFNISRLFYSRFLNYKQFNVDFQKNSQFYKLMNCFSILCIFFVCLPIFFIDIWGLTQYKWGSQFYIILIETLIFSILTAIFMVVGFRSGHKPAIQDYDQKKMLDDTSQEALKMQDLSDLMDKKFMQFKYFNDQNGPNALQMSPQKHPLDSDDDELERKLRKDQLKNILKTVQNNNSLPTQMGQDQQQKIEENLLDSLRKRRFSDQPEEDKMSLDDEDEKQQPYSYPITPKEYQNYGSMGIGLEKGFYQNDKSLPTDEHMIKKSNDIKTDLQKPVKLKNDAFKDLDQDEYSAIKSYPQSNRPVSSNSWIKKKEDEEYPNNCYFESRNASQLKKLDNQFKKDINIQSDIIDYNTQISPYKDQDFKAGKGQQDLLNEQLNQGGYESERSTTRHRKKARGKTQKQEQEALEDMLLEEELNQDSIDVIKEEDDYDEDKQQPLLLNLLTSNNINNPDLQENDDSKQQQQQYEQDQDSMMQFLEEKEEIGEQSALLGNVGGGRDNSRAVTSQSKRKYQEHEPSEGKAESEKTMNMVPEMKRQKSKRSEKEREETKMAVKKQDTMQSMKQSMREQTKMSNIWQSEDAFKQDSMQKNDSIRQSTKMGIIPQSISQVNPQHVLSDPSLLANNKPDIIEDSFSSTEEIQIIDQQQDLQHQQPIQPPDQPLQVSQQQQPPQQQQPIIQPIFIQQQHSPIIEEEEEQLIEQIEQDQQQQTLDNNDDQIDKEVQDIQMKSRLSSQQQEQEEKRIIEEMRSQMQSKLNYRDEQQRPIIKDAVSKLSQYENELDLKAVEAAPIPEQQEETDNNKQQQNDNNNDDDMEIQKINKLNIYPSSRSLAQQRLQQLKSQEKSSQQDGRISAMIKKFEEDNPDLINQQQLEDEKSQNQKSQEILAPMGIDYPPNPENRNFNENDILGVFERDTRGNLILLENKQGQIVDRNGALVNEKGYLIDGANGNVVDREKGETMFRKSQLDEMGDLPAPFSIEKYNFNPLEILGNLDYNEETMRPHTIMKNDGGQLIDKNVHSVNRSGFMVDRDGNLVDRRGRKRFDRRLLVKNDDLPQLLNYKGKKFDIRDVIGVFERDKKTGDAIIKKSNGGKGKDFVDLKGRKVNQRGYLIDPEGNIIDRRGNRIFDKVALSKNGEFPKIFPFSKFNIQSIQGDFEVDPLGNPILQRDKRNPKLLRDNRGRRVNQKGYLIDQDCNIIDNHQGNVVFTRGVLTSDEDIPKVFRKGILRKDTGDSFSRIMSEIEELERRQGSEYENEYPLQMSPDPKKKAKRQKKKQKDEEIKDNESAGNTSIESMMEDTPSNYNIANQRFEHNYYEVEEILEDGKEEGKYDEHGKRVYIKKKIAQKKKPKEKKIKKKTVFKEDQIANVDKDNLLGKAYGENMKKGQQQQPPYPQYFNQKAQPNMKIDKSKLSHLANSISGFYKDQDKYPDGLSTRMKESEVARKIPNFKEKKIKRRDSDNEQDNNNNNNQPNNESSNQSMMSLFTESKANYQSMIQGMQFGQGGGGQPKKKLRGIETIYLQRLEPSVGKFNPKKNKSKPKFRECHDRVHNAPELVAEDLTVKDELESMISDNYRHMSNQFGQLAQVPNTQRYVDLKKYYLMKDKILKENGTSSKDKESGWGGGEAAIDDEGLNIFHGNKKQYEREKKAMPKINIGKKQKF